MKTFTVILLSALLLAVAALAAAILRVLHRTSLFDIQRRAKDNEPAATALEPLVLRRGQTAAFAKAKLLGAELCLVIILAWRLWAPLAVLVAAGVLLLGGYLMQYVLSYQTSEQLAARVAPYLTKLFVMIEPATNVLRRWLVRRPADVSLPFASKAELITLIENARPDIGIDAGERSIATHSLTFSDKLIRDIMVPRRVVKGVDLSSSINLKLMSELHDTGFSRFPVFEGDMDHIVGTLYLKDLVGAAKSDTRKVKDVFNRSVYFVNQDQTLNHALNAFLRTKHHLFVVVNEFEEMTGVITIEDILEQLIGRKIVDEFDRYDDLREVAKLAAKKDKQHHTHPAEKK